MYELNNTLFQKITLVVISIQTQLSGSKLILFNIIRKYNRIMKKKKITKLSFFHSKFEL